jgi:hypothetical protein
LKVRGAWEFDAAGARGKVSGEWFGRRGRLTSFDMETAVNVEWHRPALTGHCNRMLGSAADAGTLFPAFGLPWELAP